MSISYLKISSEEFILSEVLSKNHDNSISDIYQPIIFRTFNKRNFNDSKDEFNNTLSIFATFRTKCINADDIDKQKLSNIITLVKVRYYNIQDIGGFILMCFIKIWFLTCYSYKVIATN